MNITKKKLFFNTLSITLDDELFLEALTSKKYSAITALSYLKYDLPNVRVRPKTTALIDLTLPEDEIMKRMSDTTRNEINRTYKNPDITSVSPDTNLEETYALYKHFEYDQGRVPISKSDMGQFPCFTVRYKGEILSAITVIESKPYLRIRSIFSKRLSNPDKEILKLISNASRRVMWELCLWGKKHGYQSLDLASVNFENPATANITKFKMSFGGTVVQEYTYIYSSKLFKFFERFVRYKVAIRRIIYSVFFRKG